MPAFAETYSAEMRAALFSAAIDAKRGVAGALRAAEAGELADLGAEDQRTLAGMSYGYAAELVADERQRRGMVSATKRDTTATARDMAARLLALADREVRQLEAAPRKRPVDTGRAVAAAKLTREAVAISQALDAPAKGASAKGDAPAAEQRKPKGLAARIAQGLDAAAGEPTTNVDVHGNARTAATGAHTSEQDGAHDGPVRLRVASRADSAAASSAR